MDELPVALMALTLLVVVASQLPRVRDDIDHCVPAQDAVTAVCRAGVAPFLGRFSLTDHDLPDRPVRAHTPLADPKALRANAEPELRQAHGGVGRWGQQQARQQADGYYRSTGWNAVEASRRVQPCAPSR